MTRSRYRPYQQPERRDAALHLGEVGFGQLRIKHVGQGDRGGISGRGLLVYAGSSGGDGDGFRIRRYGRLGAGDEQRHR
jgi:hypothetical protein